MTASPPAARIFTVKLVLSAFLAFLFLVIAWMPAAFLATPAARLPGLSFSQFGGTVWNGQAWGNAGGQPAFAMWQMSPWQALRGVLSLRFDLATADVSGRGRLGLGFSSIEFEALDANIPLASVPGGMLEGSGQIDVRQLSLNGRWRKPFALSHAAGRIHYGGGQVTVRMEGQVQTLNLPALEVVLSDSAEGVAAVMQTPAGELMARCRLTPSGDLHYELTERLLRTSSQYHGFGAALDAIVVSSHQKING